MKFRNTKSGFTLIEIIVSLGVFSTVVTIAVGALLVLMAANEELQGEQSVMTNLSFAMDSMTREIRTGTDYFCDSQANENAGVYKVFQASDSGARSLDDIDGDYKDCATGKPNGHRLIGVAFKESGDSITGAANEYVLYYFNDNDKRIYRRVGSEEGIPITSSDIIINNMELFVTGTKSLETGGSNSQDQAAVTIFIDASPSRSPDKNYYLQTTVTQRTLDL